jgi:hypothetical protein
VASRVAEEMGVKLGEEVGYTIRFEDITKPVRISLSFLCILLYCIVLIYVCISLKNKKKSIVV